MIKIKDIVIDGVTILAPLAGYTNRGYRKMMKEFSSPLTVSEMISDCGLIYMNKETHDMIKTFKDEHPLALQIFGGSKETLVKGVKILQENADYEILDINLGCPVTKVVKNNAGSSWLKLGREEELYECIKAVVEVSTKPVTCKIRIGWDNESINAVNTAKILEKAGVSLIAVHGRTKSQLYSGSANYEIIKQVKESVNIPVIANGDINSLDKAIEVLEYTGCDGLMIGRGALGNPYLITQIEHYFKYHERLDNPTLEDQIKYVKKHMESLLEFENEHSAVSQMKGIAPLYFKGFKDSKKIRLSFNNMKTVEDFYKILEKIDLSIN